MYRKKSQLQLQNHPFMIINNEINNVSETVDAMVKEMISPRSSFCFESLEMTFFDEEPYVIINCNYSEQKWDIDNQCLLDDYDTHDIELCFNYTHFDFEDLPLIIYSKIEEMQFGA